MPFRLNIFINVKSRLKNRKKTKLEGRVNHFKDPNKIVNPEQGGLLAQFISKEDTKRKNERDRKILKRAVYTFTLGIFQFL